MALLGVDDNTKNPMDRSPFRTAWTVPEGAGMPLIHEAKILDVNMVNWTVDCVTVFDQKRFFDIQVAAPYLHSNRGEGFYAVPEIGAKCVICLPSDGPPPFVLAFIMPAETLTDTSSDEAPDGTESNAQQPRGSTFRGGRGKGKPGDVVWRGRDGNFVIMHRGGVLQFGSTELAQRICVPLGNLVTDISQNYNHFNSGGSVNWGLRPGSPDENPETEYRHTFRVYANDEFADIRAALGKVHVPVPEPSGDAGSSLDLAALGIGGSEITVFEFVLAPGGFDSDAGQPQDAQNKTKFRMFIDRAGGTMLRAEGAVSFRTKKKLRIRADEGFEVFTKQAISMTAEGGIRIQGKSLELATDGGTVSLNGGTKPVAHVGSQVLITTVVPIPVVVGGVAGVITAGAIFSGSVSTGNPTVKV